jgi:hypothetical protein
MFNPSLPDNSLSWKKFKTSSISYGRINFAAIAVQFPRAGSWIMVYGGYNDRHGILRSVEFFDAINHVWKTRVLSPMDLLYPRNSLSGSISKIGGKVMVYAIGGISTDGLARRDIEVIAFDHFSTTAFQIVDGWSIIQGKSRIPRILASSIVHEQYLYLIGGTLALRGETERCNLLYNCTRFETLPGMLHPRYGSSAVWSSELTEILVIGGFGIEVFCKHSACDTGGAGVTGTVEGFHVSTMSWIERPPLKTPRSLLGAAEVSVQRHNEPFSHLEIYAIGGIGDGSLKRTSINEMFRCNAPNSAVRSKSVSLVFFNILFFLLACSK